MNIRRLESYSGYILGFVSLLGILTLAPTLLKKTYNIELIAKIPFVRDAQIKELSIIMRSLPQSKMVLQADLESFDDYIKNTQNDIGLFHEKLLDTETTVKLNFVTDRNDLEILKPAFFKILTDAYEGSNKADFVTSSLISSKENQIEALTKKRKIYNLELALQMHNSTVAPRDSGEFAFLVGMTPLQRQLILKADVAVMDAQINSLKIQIGAGSQKEQIIRLIPESIKVIKSGPYYREFIIYSCLIILCNLIFMIDKRYRSKTK